jgi:steroid 5-alpha reductase family enzyme
MTALYLEALAAIAVALSVLMAGAWMVQQRTGNSGWVDMIWTFSLGLDPVCVTGIPPRQAQMLRSRGDRYRDYQSRTSQFFPLRPQA